MNQAKVLSMAVNPEFLIFKKNYTIRHNQQNQTQRHKVNYFDFCFVSKSRILDSNKSKIWNRLLNNAMLGDSKMDLGVKCEC